MFEYGNERLLISILGTFANCEKDICIRYFTRITTGMEVNSRGVDPLIGFPVLLYLSLLLGYCNPYRREVIFLFGDPSLGCTGNKMNFNSRDSLSECYRICTWSLHLASEWSHRLLRPTDWNQRTLDLVESSDG